MIIVLDSNEYINHLNKKFSLDKLFSNQNLTIYINDIITREVIRSLSDLQTKEFYSIIFDENINFYGRKLSLHLLEKYKKIGLKKGDIAIAAFCENINADYLITENRHFLKAKIFDMSINRKAIFDHAQKSTIFDKFKVLSLKRFLNIVAKLHLL